MGKTTTTAKQRTATAVESGPPSRISRQPLDRDDLAGLVNLLIRRIGEELEQNDTKDFHTLAGDLLKLLALQREIGPERVEEVRVRWIECDEDASVEG